MEKYYIGLDIGTNSVGWAVTNEKYEIPKIKGKRMWGIRLFDSAQTAEERRTYRSARRRLERRKQRIDLLQKLFDREMSSIDPEFFKRLDESRLYAEDKSCGGAFSLFNDKGYTDRDYYDRYPTIYHLRKELIEDSAPHDIRLVYLAIHHILKNRGHFLISGELEDVKDFNLVAEQLAVTLEDELSLEMKRDCFDGFKNTLRDKNIPSSEKAKKLTSYFEIEIEGVGKDEIKRRKQAAENICKLIVGNKGDMKKIFAEELEGLEKPSFSFGDPAYDDGIRPNIQDILPEKSNVIDGAKTLYNWNLLADILDGEEYISAAKVEQYCIHHKKLMELKRILKKYVSRSVYREFFDGTGGKANYAAYIGSVKTSEKRQNVEKCSEDEFYKKLMNILKQIDPSEEDRVSLEKLVLGAENNTLLPLQRNKDNGMIPNQIHKIELKKILENAEDYLPFLKEKDEDGMSVSEKIISIFSFRIPYYVGPLSDRHKEQGSNSWIVRKPNGNGKMIYPWNFDKLVDREKSNHEFIRRMTNKCTEIKAEDVIPKNSLLYTKYMVLNELNNLRIRGNKISVELKQRIYDDLFRKHAKVTGKKLLEYLRVDDADLKAKDLSGFDIDFKGSLAPHLNFEKIFGTDMAKDSVRRMVEDIILWKTIYGDDYHMTEHMIEQKYGDRITDDQTKEIKRLRYAGWGKFSEKFLSGVHGINKETGEQYSIIQALWETNCNLMQLLSSAFTFREEIERLNNEKQCTIKTISYDSLVKDLMVSPSAKRSIWQAIKIVEEIRHIMGADPDKIFVEVARENEKKGKDGKGKRRESRKERLLQLYESCEDDVKGFIDEIKETEAREFDSLKLYLYYTQMGKCMYTGEDIVLDQLMDENSIWDKDHIYPRSLIKDDSLDNLVLVKKKENENKGGKLLSAEIRNSQRERWTYLLKMGLISKKKYDRLTRTKDFTDDELAGFINRQLVDTRQASKAVVDILERMIPKTRVIYVKSATVSQFRNQDLNILKSRRANDYHHAKDAYLDIVVGNVYDAKFTSDPRAWIEKTKDRKYNMNRMFDFDVYRGNTRVWEGPADKEKKREKHGGTLDIVRSTIKRNDILYTEYTYCEKGELFNATIVNKEKAASISIKKGLPTEKYGGYQSANTSYFALVEFDGEKGKRVRRIMEVPIYIANMLPYDDKAYINYCTEVKKLKKVVILRPCIKKNSLILVDGYPMRISGVSGEDLLFKNGLQPVFNRHEDMIRRIEKYLDKNAEYGDNEALDETDEKGLLALYDDITEKLSTVYEKRPCNQGENMRKNRQSFVDLSLRDKAILVNNALNLVRCDNNTTADLSLILSKKNDGSKSGSKSGSMSIKRNTVGKKELILVNQSVTGIYQTEIKL